MQLIFSTLQFSFKSTMVKSKLAYSEHRKLTVARKSWKAYPLGQVDGIHDITNCRSSSDVVFNGHQNLRLIHFVNVS